jgi:hypothetical protein
MFDLIHASLEVRKAAALQGVRSGQFEPIHHPDNCSQPDDLVCKVENSRKQIFISYEDVQAALCLTWQEINSM